MCQSLSKGFLIFINFLFVLISIALIVGGIVVQTRYNDLLDKINVDNPQAQESQKEIVKWLRYSPITALVFGACVFLLSFFGCYGALKTQKCFLVIYFAFVLALFVACLAVASFAFANSAEVVRLSGQFVENTYNTTINYQSLTMINCTTMSICRENVQNFVGANLRVAAGVVMGAAAVQLLALFSVCALLSEIRDREREREPLRAAAVARPYYTG